MSIPSPGAIPSILPSSGLPNSGLPGQPMSAGEAKLLVAVAQAHNSAVLGKVIDNSIEASARARREREAQDAERRAEEARQARFDEIERRERAEAEAVAEENKRRAAEAVRRDEEHEADLAAQQQPTLLDRAGRLDAAA